MNMKGKVSLIAARLMATAYYREVFNMSQSFESGTKFDPVRDQWMVDTLFAAPEIGAVIDIPIDGLRLQLYKDG